VTPRFLSYLAAEICPVALVDFFGSSTERGEVRYQIGWIAGISEASFSSRMRSTGLRSRP